MNNEPIAWMYKYGSGEDDWDVGLTKESEQDIPLYTAPQSHPVKTLTDEEILEISYEHSKYGSIVDIYDFARAILRKAQEK